MNIIPKQLDRQVHSIKNTYVTHMASQCNDLNISQMKPLLFALATDDLEFIV